MVCVGTDIAFSFGVVVTAHELVGRVVWSGVVVAISVEQYSLQEGDRRSTIYFGHSGT